MAKRANGEGTICKRKDGLWMTAVIIGRDAATGKSVRKYCYGKTKGEVQQKKDALLERSKGPVFIDKEFVPLSSTEWARLFTAAEADAAMYTALSLEWATGISRSELLGLKWIDFNFITDSVSIQRAVIITDNGLELDDTKTTARQRVLPLPEITILQMKQHQTRQTAAIAAHKAAGLPWEDNDLVFPDPFGKLQDPRSWSKQFKRMAKAASIDITFHKLRHDHASRLSANGVSIKDAQYRLGHSTTQMLLNVYTHRISGGQEKIASWLNSSFPVATITHETPLQ